MGDVTPPVNGPSVDRETIDHWKIVGPISVFGRHYATRADAEEIRRILPDPEAHHLRAYNRYGKIVVDEKNAR